MDWNKINLKSKEKNLPIIGKDVLWAVKDENYGKYHKFIGKMIDSGVIDTGLKNYKVTSKYYWCYIDDPEE